MPSFSLSRATFIDTIRFGCLCGLLDRCLSGLMCTTIAWIDILLSCNMPSRIMDPILLPFSNSLRLSKEYPDRSKRLLDFYRNNAYVLILNIFKVPLCSQSNDPTCSRLQLCCYVDEESSKIPLVCPQFSIILTHKLPNIL